MKRCGNEVINITFLSLSGTVESRSGINITIVAEMI